MCYELWQASINLAKINVKHSVTLLKINSQSRKKLTNGFSFISKMKLIVAICFFFVSEAFSKQTDIIPDCFAIKSGYDVKCYTISTGISLNREESRRQCQKNNGDLALVTDDYTWNQITENILNREPFASTSKDVWVRPKVPRSSSTLQDADGLSQTLFWSNNHISYDSYNDRCMIAQKSNNWKWNIQIYCSNNLPFLCEYNVTYCNIFDLNIENANFDACHSSQIVGINESVLIDCWKGYVIKGNANVRCERGLWQKPLPICYPGCKSPGLKKNSKFFHLKSQYNVGEEVTYLCNKNYYYWKSFEETHFVVTCQKDGTWSEEDAYCTDEKFKMITFFINEHQYRASLHCTLLGRVTWFHAKENSNEKPNTIQSLSPTLVLDISNKTNAGFYFCRKEYKNGTIEIGSNFYKLIDSGDCDNIETEEKIEIEERESIILSCHYKTGQISVKWYKDGKEIVSRSENRDILPDNGLYLKRAQLSDEGIYKCEVIYGKENHYCNYVASYKLTVNASVESICGHSKYNGISIQHRESAPWLTILQQDDEISPFCYGTLLNSDWIVTSAFCLSNLRRKKEIKIHARFHPDENKTDKYPVKLIRVHPEYRSRLYANDIGLIKLQEPGIKFSNAILPICSSGIDFRKKEKCDTSELQLKGEVSGWQSLLVVDSKEMKFAIENMSYVSQDKCSEFFGFAKDMFCVEKSGNGTVYAGDSGSPFVVNYNGRKYLMGIFNWGQRISHTGKYDYFTNIYFHYDWIKESMKNT